MTLSPEIKPGFRDPVLDAQSVFRSLLEATARPGRIHTLEGITDAPAPLHPATAALCLTLVDHDTPLWIAPELQTEESLAFLRFHCGCPIIDTPGEAAFALASADKAPALSSCTPGEQAFPERSTTLIVQTDGLEAATGSLTLRGPGIESVHRLSVKGLRPGFWGEWQENGSLFPCGVDLIFVHGTDVVSLPRTTVVDADPEES